MLPYSIKQILTNINKYILHVLSIKFRYKLYFSFSILTPGFPHFYYMLGANLGLLLYGEVSMMVAIYAKRIIFNYEISHLYRKAEIRRQIGNGLPVYLFLPLSIGSEKRDALETRKSHL